MFRTFWFLTSKVPKLLNPFFLVNEAAAAKRAAKTSGILRDNRGPIPLPPISGVSSGARTVNNSPVYNITVTSQPGQEAATAAETKSRLEAQRTAAFVRVIPSGDYEKRGSNIAGNGQQPARCPQELPRGRPRRRCERVLWNHALGFRLFILPFGRVIFRVWSAVIVAEQES